MSHSVKQDVRGFLINLGHQLLMIYLKQQQCSQQQSRYKELDQQQLKFNSKISLPFESHENIFFNKIKFQFLTCEFNKSQKIY
ncbi:hypothetical protein pb186bvf_007672 [Paramecium bursaria]